MCAPLRLKVAVVLLALLLPGVEAAGAQSRFPGAEWTRAASPESVGWDGAKLRAAFDYADSIGSSAIMVIHNGQVVAEHGNTAQKLHVFSVRKSFQSALVGLLVADGRLSLDATLATLGIDDIEPSLTDVEKQATVRHLLMARSGVYHEAAYETPGMVNRRPARGTHKPGEFWFYNNWDFNALGTIIERAAGKSMFELFDERIAKPIGMQDFHVSDGEVVREAASAHGAHVFRMSARDVARFGLLYLERGRWNDRQIIPEAWVRESTQPHTDIGLLGGYGYLWWVALRGKHFLSTEAPEGTYSARGTGEQNLVIYPAWNLVVVHRADAEGARRRGEPFVRVTNFARLLQGILAARPSSR